MLDSTRDGFGTIERCRIPKKEDPIKHTIRAGLFFDGTCNNRFNIGLRLKGASEYTDDSYQGEETNISRLEQNYGENKTVNHSFHIYVEGIGTKDGEHDKFEGYLAGVGAAGIIAKVDSGVSKLILHIVNLQGILKKIEYLHLDVFGFSRGAAAARHFAWVIFNNSMLKEKLAANGFAVDRIQIKFIGLYDTVVSYWGPSDLHLDSLSNAERVVQLAAAEEHRKHFPLTNIVSAGTKGLQIFLPGAHSDVGGGYNENGDAVEEELQILDFDRVFGLSDADNAAFKREVLWLLALGWYSQKEINGIDSWNELTVTRHDISNKYSYVPLQLMGRLAAEAGVTISEKLTLAYSIHEKLSEAMIAIDAYANGISHRQVSHPNDWLESKSEMMKDLRHRFLHFSAHYGSKGGAHVPRFSNEGDPIEGHRERDILPG
jgi:uncharacterized short protein YbdD (DUF466 family)